MRLRVQASQSLTVYVDYGTVEAILAVYRNGVEVAQTYWSVSGPYNITGTATDILVLDELVTCKAGDQIQIKFYFDRRTTLADWTTILIIEPETTWASFTPDGKTYPGDTWLVARNLPKDMSCLDLMVSLALATSSTYQVDDLRKSVDLIQLDKVTSSESLNGAIDWSNRVDESEELTYTPTLEPYGRRNFVRWKEFDFPVELDPTRSASTSSAGTPRSLQFGDGVINCSAPSLPYFTELFELPFAACQNSDTTLNNYGTPVLIRTRKLTGLEKTLERSSTTPRLILMEPSQTIVVAANVFTPESTVESKPVTLTGCWWGIRPYGVSSPANSFTLAFDRVDSTQAEQPMIFRHFKGLKRILRRPRLLSISMSLTPEDIATLDLTKPIRLKKVRVGSLDIGDGFFFLSKIANYNTFSTCLVDLVAFF